MGPHPCAPLPAPAARLCLRSSMLAGPFIRPARLHAQHLLLSVRLDGHIALGVGVAGLGEEQGQGNRMGKLSLRNICACWS